jgi:CheY-like chemotaxis protein
MHTVYLLEPQTLFVPALTEVVAAAGGSAVRSAGAIDVEELASLRTDYALLDLDYTEVGVVDGLAIFRAVAPSIKLILLTEERDLTQITRYRNAGAAAVISKTLSAERMRDALRTVFQGSAPWTSLRADVAVADERTKLPAALGPGSRNRFACVAAFLLAGALLAACGGGGSGGAGATPRIGSGHWIAALRYEPMAMHLNLSNSALQYMYVDAGATNGVYPSAQAFAAEIEAANPELLTGPCSPLARMSATTMDFVDANGVHAPSYVVFFAPRAAGACTQAIALGDAGTKTFSVTVTE